MMHSKVVRAFCESVLRYGLVSANAGEPPTTSFVSVILQPKNESKLRQGLLSFFDGESMEHATGDDLAEDEEEYLPYVCVKVPILAGD
mmetsp:Transcript_11330/g.42308  ORF Transcript_11330/g.42308 Transcript_11330/m.42308 type:complete len:88 (+) Transcript_11330:1291-1554(+)|eukprot:scaffold433_cov257-Pinguiococcus_pyrenoidosus.AAC.31